MTGRRMDMKIFKKILCTLLVVVMCLTSAPLDGFVGIEWSKLPEINFDELFACNASAADLAETGQCGDSVYWKYDSTTGELVISGNGAMTDYYSSVGSPFYNSVIKSIIIKDGVTSIGRYAFYYCKELASISIPDTVTIIRSDAFNGCLGLADITIPKSVTLIGDRAFYNCESLTNIKISDKVTSICNFVFTGCKGLASITVDDNNEYYSNDKFGVLFNKDKTTLIQYPIGNSRISYTIPNSVTLVDSAAFYNCTVLRELKIPASTRIYNSPYTFYNCTNLETITLTKGTGIMCDYGSGNYNGLNPITSFDCTPWNSSRNNLKNLVIEDGVKNIGSYAFCCCKNLSNIEIPDSITSIGKYAFQQCGFETVLIPDSVTTIDVAAFSFCKNLKSITIPSSVISIGASAFYGSDNLRDLYYYGSESQWNKISFGEDVCLENAEIHFLGSDISHIPGEWEVTLEATYDNDGKKVVRCITCGEILEEESIPKLVGKELVDTDTGVIIDLGTGLYNGKVDIIVNKSADENAFNLVHTATGAVKSDIYDINLTIDGVISQPKGYVTVKIPVPNGYNPNRCFIYYINTKNGSAEKIPTRYEDGYLVFETNHFSYYAVVEIDNTDNVDCSCNCHKGGIKGFFFKLILFFQKIFKSNKECKCGINHY